jgi:hypothetical protein
MQYRRVIAPPIILPHLLAAPLLLLQHYCSHDRSRPALSVRGGWGRGGAESARLAQDAGAATASGIVTDCVGNRYCLLLVEEGCRSPDPNGEERGSST